MILCRCGNFREVGLDQAMHFPGGCYAPAIDSDDMPTVFPENVGRGFPNSTARSGDQGHAFHRVFFLSSSRRLLSVF